MTKLSKPADDGSNARGSGAQMTMTGLARLAPYKRNARIHSKKQIRQIASSIERFGFTNPILIDDNDMILAGHGRAAAARLLGMDMVPTIRLSAMSDADIPGDADRVQHRLAHDDIGFAYLLVAASRMR